jgi:hypothetical protein
MAVKLTVLISTLAIACTAHKPTLNWEGQVRGVSGNVLPGVTIEWRGQKIFTNELGRFSLVERRQDSIRIHAVGFESKSILVKKEGDLSITLTAQQPEVRQIP